ncbi:MAG: type II toxin-antitoxin system prevent-host-death family antitoxin [Deltaproteobacteria bacterium]|nr:type II toxin-antitoxin system prevent-host-death family antitoxin [Deltaproteobacteria bacterium]
MNQRKTIGSYEAKTNLSQLLELVAKGKTFTITKRGRPIAILSPAESAGKETLDSIVSRIKELRKNFALGKIEIKGLIAAGRE